MKIHLAAVEPMSNVRLVHHFLFSYYDIAVSTIPFRRVTFNHIYNECKQKMIAGSLGDSETGVSKQGDH